MDEGLRRSKMQRSRRYRGRSFSTTEFQRESAIWAKRNVFAYAGLTAVIIIFMGAQMCMQVRFNEQQVDLTIQQQNVQRMSVMPQVFAEIDSIYFVLDQDRYADSLVVKYHLENTGRNTALGVSTFRPVLSTKRQFVRPETSVRGAQNSIAPGDTAGPFWASPLPDLTLLAGRGFKDGQPVDTQMPQGVTASDVAYLSMNQSVKRKVNQLMSQDSAAFDSVQLAVSLPINTWIYLHFDVRFLDILGNSYITRQGYYFKVARSGTTDTHIVYSSEYQYVDFDAAD